MRRAALALALIAAACGGSGGSTTSPATWANRLCTDLGAWLTSVKDGADQLRQAQTSATTLEQARAHLVDYLDTAAGATDRLLDRTTSRPDVDQGKALADAIRAGIEKAKAVFEEGRAKARRLPVDDADAYRARAQALSADIGRAGPDLQESVSRATRRYRSATIDRALREQPACRRLGTDATTTTL